MKNIYRYAMISALMVASVFVLSCQTDEPGFVPGASVSRPDKDQTTEDKGVLTFVTDTIAVPKTHWNGNSIVWSKGDIISIGYILNDKWSDKMYASAALSSAAVKARFKVKTDLTGTEKGKMSFYGVYPSTAVKSDFSGAPLLKVEVPSRQSVSGISYDRDADIMIAKSVNEYDSVPEEAVTLMWNRVVAHADITLEGLTFKSGETLRSVALTTDAGVCGNYEINLENGECKVTDITNGLVVNVSSFPTGSSGSIMSVQSFCRVR